MENRNEISDRNFKNVNEIRDRLFKRRQNITQNKGSNSSDDRKVRKAESWFNDNKDNNFGCEWSSERQRTRYIVKRIITMINNPLMTRGELLVKLDEQKKSYHRHAERRKRHHRRAEQRKRTRNYHGFELVHAKLLAPIFGLQGDKNLGQMDPIQKDAVEMSDSGWSYDMGDYDEGQFGGEW